MLHRVKTIVVGVEPLTEPVKHLTNVLKLLSWFGTTDLKIFFVGVLNPNDVGWPREFTWEDASGLAEIQAQAISKINSILEQAKFGANFEVKIFIQNSASKSATVAAFEKFGAENQADVFVIHSHTKSQIKAALGTFCSKLIHTTKIPILIAPFEGTVSPHLKAILFPTDFSELSKRVFNSVVKWTGQLKSRVILYHRMARPIDEILQIASHPTRGRTVMPSDIVLIADANAKKKAAEWLEINHKLNPLLTFEMNSDGLTLPSAIIQQAKIKNVELIALPTHSSFVNVLSFGSAVSHVVRASTIPVLVIPETYIPPGEFPE